MPNRAARRRKPNPYLAPKEKPPERRLKAEPRPKKKGKGKGRARRPLWLRLALWALVAAVWVFLGIGGLVLWYARDLPDIDAFVSETRSPSVTLLADDGSVIASYGDLYGKTLTVAEMAPALPQAVMAIEDRRFYDHFGIDIWGVARALFTNISEGELRQGGSTITQQLAKILFLTPERSLKRKVQEAILAFQLEARYDKDKILGLYLNRVYLGAAAYGVDAAAYRFFGKSARDLNLYEAAMIAGALKAPSRLNPLSDWAAADARARVVLDAMVEADYVTQAEADAAYAEKSSGAPVVFDQGRYFGDWALQQVSGFLGSYARDLVVETTLDPRLQAIAEAELQRLIAEDAKDKGVTQGAFVALSPDGAVRAMVGGTDYKVSPFNRATQALRQPGSSFKLFVFLAAMEAGLKPDSVMQDAPVTVGDWSPENYNEKYYGEVTLREAFARSLNSVAARLIDRVGYRTVQAAARRLGITTDMANNASLALGTAEVSLLELTGAYAVFANEGYGLWPYAIKEIRGVDGTILYRRQGERLARLVAPSVVNDMTDLLSAVVSWGTGQRAQLDRPAAGKTGTTQSYRDAWFLGFTAELVGGVWLGNDDNQPMEKVSGGLLPALLWQRIMSQGLAGLPVAELPGGGEVAADDPPASGPEGDAIADILEKLEATQPPGAEPTTPGSDELPEKNRKND